LEESGLNALEEAVECSDIRRYTSKFSLEKKDQDVIRERRSHAMKVLGEFDFKLRSFKG